MAVLSVNPNRMELTNLKRKLVTALRGHKLLKDKRDELMRQFLELVFENRTLRLEVESAIKQANNSMALARSVMQNEVLDVALMLPKQQLQLEIETRNVMSVLIPVFKPEFKTADSGDVYSYGYAFTLFDLDSAIKIVGHPAEAVKAGGGRKVMPAYGRGDRKDRRRVNALEHVLILSIRNDKVYHH